MHMIKPSALIDGSKMIACACAQMSGVYGVVRARLKSTLQARPMTKLELSGDKIVDVQADHLQTSAVGQSSGVTNHGVDKGTICVRNATVG